QVGAAHPPAGQSEALERLRAGDLVHQVQVDVEQVGFPIGTPDDVLLPDLLGHRACHLRRLPVYRWTRIRSGRVERPHRLARNPPARRGDARRAGFAFQIARRQYQAMDNSSSSSGVGVLDKTMSVLDALEAGPASLAQLVKITG